MRVRRHPAAAALAVAAACAGSVLAFLFWGEGETAGNGSGEPAPTSETKMVVAEQASFLVVDQHLEKAFFTEGAFPYVKLESADGEVVAERLLRDTRTILPLLRQRLAPGAYRLMSHQRPCTGSCPAYGVRGLDPPTLRCEATFEVRPGQTLAALVRVQPGLGCRIVLGERVDPVLARQEALAACRQIADDRDHGLRYWASAWGATSTRPEDLGDAYAGTTFRGFGPSIQQAAIDGCAEGIRTVKHPIRFLLEATYSVGQTIDVAIENVGRRPYVFQAFYQACFLSYFDSSRRHFIIPPGTHCDILSEETIRPGERRKLFTWRLDECLKDQWGCVRSRPLPSGTYTIKGRFKSKDGGRPAGAEKTFEIVAA
jgi:hypothetical protein